ncbi:MAG: hypothetical protein CMP76_03955 [Flavobacterium sp.]|uniref:hypothetical protein n=1 Tax=Flavobacterium sp. TaxID=239 RepID=UPI000C56D190|nr:hypothetical protein [Flavobacterium sp.]MBF02431.1 hypothetical protein [Flavobacterium sp.]|tara:strand:+ start:68 stop:268 length:201 start_codon:yes stop_codon:yes gene_type:complete
MEKDLQLLRDYKKAMLELAQFGTVSTSLVEVLDKTFFRVSITIENNKIIAEHEDQMIAIIQLRNQI